MLTVGDETSLNVKRYEFRVNLFRTHVTVVAREGALTMSVRDLREKLYDGDLLPPVRQMYREMLDAAKAI